MSPDGTTALTVDLCKKFLRDSVHQLYEVLANKPSATNESGAGANPFVRKGIVTGIERQRDFCGLTSSPFGTERPSPSRQTTRTDGIGNEEVEVLNIARAKLHVENPRKVVDAGLMVVMKVIVLDASPTKQRSKYHY